MPHPPRIVWMTFVVGLAFASVLVVLGSVVSSEALAIGPELTEAGMQVGAVTLVGSWIAYQLHTAQEMRTEQREDEAAKLEDKRRKADYRSRIFHDVVTAYNGVKSVRRVLRANGFRNTAHDRAMTAEDAKEFNVCMQSLTESQLLFEGVLHQVKARPDWFGSPDALRVQVGTLAQYIRDVVDDWESTDGEAVAGAPLTAIHSLVQLQAFLDDSHHDFAARARDPMREIANMLREDAYPSS